MIQDMYPTSIDRDEYYRESKVKILEMDAGCTCSWFNPSKKYTKKK